MSLQNDLGLTQSELQDVSPNLRDRILGGYAKTKALDLLTANQMFRRDSKRLSDMARAVRRKQGLKMPDDEDEEIVLGDKTTTINKGVSGIAAIGAGLLSGGIIGGAIAALPWIMELMKPEPVVVQDPPAVVQPGSPDSWSDVTPGFGEPELRQ